MATAREESGEGAVFGHKVSAYLLGALAAKRHYATFCNAPVVEVSLQTSWEMVHYDDQSVTTDNGFVKRRHHLQCKLKLRPTPSDKTFQKVLGRAYTAILKESNPDEYESWFVIVFQECSRPEDLTDLLNFAEASQTLHELRKKLKAERNALETTLNAIRDAVSLWLKSEDSDTQEALDDTCLHLLLKRLRVWKCDLNLEGSHDRSAMERDLLPFCESDIDKAKELYRRYLEESAREECRRATHTWDSLKQKYGGLTKPRTATELEGTLTRERVGEMEATVEEYIQDLPRRTFESYLGLKSFLEKREPLLKGFVVQTSEEHKRFALLIAKATMKAAGALLKINGAQILLREWVERCKSFADLYPPIWTTIGRCAVKLGDEDLVHESIQNIPCNDDKQFVKALVAEAAGNTEEACQLYAEINGQFKLDSYISRAVLVQALSMSEENCKQARLLMDMAHSLDPKSIPVQLMRAAIIQQWHRLDTSEVYLAAGTATPDVREDLVPCIRTCEAISLETHVGIFERLLAARLRMEPFNIAPTIPAYLGVSSEEVLEISKFQDKEEQERNTSLLMQLGKFHDARCLLDLPITSTQSDEERAYRAWLVKLAENPKDWTPPPLVHQTAQRYILTLRNAFFYLAGFNLSAARRVFEEIDGANVETSFSIEIRFVDSILRNDFASAQHSLERLASDYPYAVGTWCNLYAWVNSFISERELELGSVSNRNEELYAITVKVARYATDLLPVSEHYRRWINFTSLLGKDAVSELAEVTRHATKSGNSGPAAVAEAILCSRRLEFERASELFDRAEEFGRLPPNLRAERDRCKLMSGKHQDIAAGAEDILAEKGRDPAHAGLTVYALSVLNRPSLAIDVARRNWEDFPNEETAHWLYAQTCLNEGEVDTGMELLQFYAELFPGTERLKTVEVDAAGEDAFEILSQSQEWHAQFVRKYETCEFPLKLLPGNLSVNYERFSKSMTGLQVNRTFLASSLPTSMTGSALLMDYTSFLTVSRFSLWEMLAESELTLLVPDFVLREIRADAERLNLELNREQLKKYRSLRAVLDNKKIESIYVACDAEQKPIKNLTIAEANSLVAKDNDLEVVGASGHDISLRELLDLAKRNGLLDVRSIGELVSHLPNSNDSTKPRPLPKEFPKGVLIDDQTVLYIASLPNPSLFLNLFDRVVIGPAGHFCLGLQFGQIQDQISGHNLANRLVGELQPYVESGRIAAVETQGSHPEGIDYFRELANAAKANSATVWVDDMATRRLLLSETPAVCSVCTFDVLIRLVIANPFHETALGRVALELTSAGHRDPQWPNTVLFGRDTPVGRDQARVYIRRLVWQVNEGHLTPEEKHAYFEVLVQNVLSALSVSSEVVLDYVEVVINNLEKESRRFIFMILRGLVVIDHVRATDVALELVELGHEKGYVKLEEISSSLMLEVTKRRPDTVIPVGYPSKKLFTYWFGLARKLHQENRDSQDESSNGGRQSKD